MIPKIKLSGIYKIEHSSGKYYIGMSVDIFSRWSSHITALSLNKHSSIKFQTLWNNSIPEEWTFQIMLKVSKTELKKTSGLKGKEFEKLLRKTLLAAEKKCMQCYSLYKALNANNRYFNKPQLFDTELKLSQNTLKNSRK